MEFDEVKHIMFESGYSFWKLFLEHSYGDYSTFSARKDGETLAVSSYEVPTCQRPWPVGTKGLVLNLLEDQETSVRLRRLYGKNNHDLPKKPWLRSAGIKSPAMQGSFEARTRSFEVRADYLQRPKEIIPFYSDPIQGVVWGLYDKALGRETRFDQRHWLVPIV